MKIIHRGETPELLKVEKTSIRFTCDICKTIWIANISEYAQYSERTPKGNTIFKSKCPVCHIVQRVAHPNYSIPYVSEDDCDE